MDLIVLKRNEEDNIMYIIEENKFETTDRKSVV